jgi:hypothetical protein
MGANYFLDYFLFTFFASLAIIQIASSKKMSARAILGVVVLLSSYFWFFGSKDRNVSTTVEGVQLFITYGAAAILALGVTKVLTILGKSK